MTKTECSYEILALIEQYNSIGGLIKQKLKDYNKQFKDTYCMDEEGFYNSFAPLYGDTPEGFRTFRKYFNLINE